MVILRKGVLGGGKAFPPDSSGSRIRHTPFCGDIPQRPGRYFLFVLQERECLNSYRGGPLLEDRVPVKSNVKIYRVQAALNGLDTWAL